MGPVLFVLQANGMNSFSLHNCGPGNNWLLPFLQMKRSRFRKGSSLPEPTLFPSRLSRGYVTHSGGGGEVPQELRQEKVGIRLGL